MGAMVVKYRPWFAKSGFVMDALLRHVLHNTDHGPRDREAEAQEHE
jgi:hypothetical protein